jgi:hypothetical protein
LLSNATVTIAVKLLAAFRVGEACEILVGPGKPLRGCALTLDKSEGEAEADEFADETC